ncbi:sugar kinase [Clostridium arbusti]|uniref:sugar kinase n=1 Tax=Clostridium arbusti TaxID=1137848 RepID=UPI000287E90A|nr:sugar kinase [Clostridium arbusti]
MAKKVVTMGELLLRLTTPGHSRLAQAKSFDAIYGGAEANVAVFLANMGMDSYFLTALPDNGIGDSALNFIRNYGVKTDYIVRTGDRVGIYFLEKGTSVRPSKVVYDRKNSAICDIDVNDIDFEEVFKDAEWFHLSGITPALGEKCILLVEKAVEYAKKKGVHISVDLNYRSKLWSYDQFESVISRFINDIDVCFGWLSSSEKGGKHKIADFAKQGVDLEKLKNTFSNMKKRFNIKYVVTTLRENYSADHNALSALIYNGEELYQSNKYDFTIQDRVGTGDAFAAGLIYKLANGVDYKEALEFGVASGVFKHTIEGDFNICTEDEIMALVKGNTSGSVQR